MIATDKPSFLTRDRQKTSSTKVARKSNATSIVVGILIVLLIAVAITRMLISRPDPNAIQRVKVVAAQKDILPGTRINYSHIRYMSVPTDYLDEGLFQKTNVVVGHVTKHFIPARNPIHKAFLHPTGKSMSHSIENHERAITLKIEEEGLVDHHLFPGDRVDVLATMTKGGKKYTKTICKDVPVLSSVTKDMLESREFRGDSKNRVTLAVTPDAAEILTEAEQAGKLKLILRNKLTTSQPSLGGVGEDDLLPEKAHLEEALKKSAAVQAVGSFGALPPVPIPEPPPFEPLVSDSGLPPVNAATAMPDPVGWIVEVFSGSQKSTLTVGGGK